MRGGYERRNDRLEKINAARSAPTGAYDEPRAHRRSLAYHGEQASARGELIDEAARQYRRRSGQHDDVVRCVARPAARGVADFDGHVFAAVALEVASTERGECRLDLHR